MRLGVMCSGNGTNFENIITNPICNKHEVVLMIHNTKQCGAVKRAAKFGIPHVRVPHKDEDKMIDLFRVWRVDLIVLAGYMRVIKDPDAFPVPIINVHPSLLPKYKGLHAVEQAIDSGDEETPNRGWRSIFEALKRVMKPGGYFICFSDIKCDDQTVIGEFIRPEDIVRMAEESGLILTSEYNYSRDDRFSHSCNLGVASFVFTKE